MANLISINLTLSKSLTQAQETILVISKQLPALKFQTKTKKPATNKTVLDKKPIMINQSATAGIMGEPADWTIPSQPAISPIQDTK